MAKPHLSCSFCHCPPLLSLSPGPTPKLPTKTYLYLGGKRKEGKHSDTRTWRVCATPPKRCSIFKREFCQQKGQGWRERNELLMVQCRSLVRRNKKFPPDASCLSIRHTHIPWHMTHHTWGPRQSSGKVSCRATYIPGPLHGPREVTATCFQNVFETSAKVRCFS